MKLSPLNRDYVLRAAELIDDYGIPKDNVWSQYQVVVEGKEYPFSYLVRTANELAGGTKMDKSIHSNESYHNYVRNLGFVVNYNARGYSFFTREELEYFKSIAKEDYRKANTWQKYYSQKLNPLMEKLNYWAKELLYGDFILKTDRRWLTEKSRITYYFWPRIYKGNNNDIFFNVEVNVEGGWIGYKLGAYKKLPSYKRNFFESYKENIGCDFIKIPIANIENYNWDSLIDESKSFINRFENNYDELKLLLGKEEKISRIAWNTNSWIAPSGPTGKSTNPSYEQEHGFGHEEWLFDKETIIDGYKYGFLEPIHKFKQKHVGKVYDIALYSRDSDKKQDYWITTLRNVEVITDAQSKEILTLYKKKGWYKVMKQDLKNENLEASLLDDWIKKDASALFNIRFKAEQLNDISSDYLLVESKKHIPSNRYVLMDANHDILEKYDGKKKLGFDFKQTGSSEADLATGGKRKWKKQEQELEYKHSIIQNAFLEYLQEEYGTDRVKRECRAYGASRIDVSRETDEGYIFYEIKTYNNLMTSLRIAIGQLMEYCLFPEVQQANELVVVSDIPPSETVKRYIEHLRKFIAIPFKYIQFDPTSKKVISIV